MAQRVNTKFLIILTTALAVVIVTTFAAYFVIAKRRGNPDEYLAKAEAFMKAKEYDKALAHYKQATGLAQTDPAMWVRYGDAHSKLAALDTENMGLAIGCWRKALEIDPNYKPALQRMLEVFEDQLDRTPPRQLPSLITDTRDVARKLEQADPKDLQAKMIEPELTIRGWVSGIATDDQTVDEAIKELKQLSAKVPEDADAAYWAAMGITNRARQAINDRNPEQAKQFIAEADTVMLDAVKAQDQNPLMHLRAGEYLFNTRAYASLNSKSTTVPADEPAAEQDVDAAAASQPTNPVAKRVLLARTHFQRATELAKPDHPDYVEIHLKAGALAQQMLDRSTAEKIYREVLKHFPDAQDARLYLAGLLADDPSKRDEAIAILDKPVAPESMSGAKGLMAQSLKIQTLVALTNLRLDKFAATGDAAEKKKLMTSIEDGISKVAALAPGGQDNPLTLKLRGKQQRVSGEPGSIVKSIQTLNRAMTLLEQQDAVDEDLLELLARSYADTGETGQAKTLLKRVVDRSPVNLGARMLLAQLHLKDGDAEEAKPYVDALTRFLPNHPDVIKLRLATLNRKDDAAEAKELYAKLPETNRAERMNKAQVAVGMQNPAEAIRLLEEVRKQDPNDVDASIGLARLYAGDDKAKAVAIVEDALKAHPDNTVLQVFQKQLADASPEELREFQRQLIEKTADPLQRELAMARMARSEGKPDETLQHLKAAERIKGDDRTVLDELFVHHLSRQEWDQAAAYVEKLAKIDGDQAGGLLYRFRLALARGDSAAALGYARELTNKLPEFAQSWLSLAQAEQASRQFDDAIQHYQQALEKQNENADALRGLIESSLALERVGEAKKYLDQALSSLPNNAMFRDMAINYELNYGDVAKAVAAREEFLKAQPKNPQAMLGAARTNLVAAQRSEDPATAEKYIARALELSKQGSEAFPDEQAFYAVLVDAALRSKQGPQAEQALKAWSQRDAWKDRPEPRMMLADFYARDGKLPEAEKIVRELAAKDPSNVGVQLALVDLLVRQNKGDEAVAALDAANPSDPRIVQRRIELDIAGGKLDEADKRLQSAIAANPRSVDLLALSGFVNLSRQKWEVATARLNEVLSIDPRNAQAQYYLALVKLQQPRVEVDEAIRLLTSVRDQNPSNVDARYMLGQAYRRRNDLDNAARELDTALQLQPDNKGIRLTLLSVYADAVPPRWSDVERVIRAGRALPGMDKDADLLRAEAMMWLARNDHAKAKDLIAQAIAAAPQSAQLKRDQISILLRANDNPGVIAETDKLLAGKEDPELWWALEARGVAKGKAGDREAALKDLEAALTLSQQSANPSAPSQVIGTISREIGTDEALARVLERAAGDPRWSIMAAMLYQQQGKLDEAVAQAEKAMASLDKFDAPTQQTLLRIAGTLYLARSGPDDPKKAYEAYLKLLDQTPNDLATLNNMAVLLTDSMQPPRLAEARKYSQKAYDLMINAGANEPLLLDTHGWVLTLNGRVDEGIDLLRRAVAAAPITDAHYHLAEAYLKRSEPQEAEKQLLLAEEEIQKIEARNGAVSSSLKEKIADAKVRTQRALQEEQAKAAS